MATLRQKLCGFVGHNMTPEYLLHQGLAIKVDMVCIKCGCRTKWYDIPNNSHQPKDTTND